MFQALKSFLPIKKKVVEKEDQIEYSKMIVEIIYTSNLWKVKEKWKMYIKLTPYNSCFLKIQCVTYVASLDRLLYANFSYRIWLIFNKI